MKTEGMTEAEINARHAEKMRKKKAARDKIIATKTIEKGLLIVHTGKGKGKSTAAFGMVLRAIGHGMQGRRSSSSSRASGRPASASRWSSFGDQVDHQHDGRRIHLGNTEPRPRHRRRRAAWEKAKA